MDAADIHSTLGDTSQSPPAVNATVGHETEPSSITSSEHSIPRNSYIPNAYLDLLVDGSDVEMHAEGQNLTHPFKSDQEHQDIQPARNETNHGYAIAPQSDPNQVILPAIYEEVLLSEAPEVPASGPTSTINLNDHSELSIAVYSQEPPSLCSRTVSATSREREGDTELDPLTYTQMLPTELDCVDGANLPCLTDEEDVRDDLDDPCKHFPSSLPPSSSPPQLFSSSPCASSQSSVSDGVAPSKLVLVDEVEGPASPRGCSYTDHVAPVAQGESRLESEQLRGCETADVTTSPEANNCFVESSTGLSKKRVYQSDTDESCESHPTKRPKLDSALYLPPTPMRATLASQSRQFKKLAAPFRPPSKLPVSRDEQVQTTVNRVIGSASSSTPEINHDKPDAKESTTQVSRLQHIASNTSRSITQFKSPLVNRALPDTRTIRLTPALQALERKLQQLKRAIKIKEDNEEEVLTRLAGKWIEAGREVAYDVWDASKDTADFGGKTTRVCRSYGWEGTNDGNMSWGWDNKLGDRGEESGDVDPSMTSCASGRLIVEEDNEVVNNTLGTMLRQLGIAPEIFGWDDDKEGFSD